ncbi:GLPGLI family protein [Epilithonimonas hispanica]|uniref:GLPGLI family protein n=1 Tax=Epilithonimonas hispanica TaxID=358687 RepID=A0A3D9D5L3_9FLAO|nr:GLPGLI family protein [Epilithonimonas hispanica]REC73279.1 GLPGLI family protein [Epilithonimonas hispanica]
MNIFKLIFILGIFNAFFVKAQTHRFLYHISFKADSLSNDYTKKVSVLDIEKNRVKFFPEDFLIKDSIRIKTGNYNYSYENFDYQLIRYNNSGVNINYATIVPLYYSYTTNDNQDWKIVNETKEVNGLQLQKATTFFGGRHWEAWFSLSFPFQEGPYKFRGLPGLIVELKDDKNQFIFQLAKNVNLSSNFDTSFYLENLNEEKPIKISEEAYKKIKIDNFINPLKDFGDQEVLFKDESGNLTKLNVKDYTKRTQDYLRKYNNPIELDKAIYYPK